MVQRCWLGELPEPGRPTILITRARGGGGSMVLGKTSSTGASYNLDDSRARAYCTCSRCGFGGLDIFTLLYPFSSYSLWETA